MEAGSVIYSKSEIIRAADLLVDWIVEERRKSRAKKLVLLPVLEGALPFFGLITRGLIRRGYTYDYQVLQARSYDDARKQREIELVKGLEGDWGDHLIVLIDDIYDTGKTAELFFHHIMKTQRVTTSRLRGVFLIHKKEDGRFRSVGVDCKAMLQVPDVWLYGFGMDLRGKQRGLDCICVAKPSVEVPPIV